MLFFQVSNAFQSVWHEADSRLFLLNLKHDFIWWLVFYQLYKFTFCMFGLHTSSTYWRG